MDHSYSFLLSKYLNIILGSSYLQPELSVAVSTDNTNDIAVRGSHLNLLLEALRSAGPHSRERRLQLYVLFLLHASPLISLIRSSC